MNIFISSFIFILIIFGIVVAAKSIEPVLDKQISKIFADKKLSKKINKELMNMTEDFTPEKREFYKKIIISFYVKWLPLIEESRLEAEEIIVNSK